LSNTNLAVDYHTYIIVTFCFKSDTKKSSFNKKKIYLNEL